jgi:hypothetical protein
MKKERVVVAEAEAEERDTKTMYDKRNKSFVLFFDDGEICVLFY